MHSRQARGLISIRSNCAFDVTRLEVALAVGDGGSIALDWYAALSLEASDVANRTLLGPGGTLGASDLQGSNASMVMLSDGMDLSSVGAILLCERTASGDSVVLASALIQKLVPGPAADLLLPQPTYFDNCLGLGRGVRVRWSIVEGDTDESDGSNSSSFLDIGLEYVVPGDDAENTWMAFGPASPGVQDRLMGGSDVAIGGFRTNDDAEEAEEDAMPFGHDYYIGGYEVCTERVLEGVTTLDGVCRDTVWAGGTQSDQKNEDNVKLVHAQILEGVAFVRLRRPLLAATSSEWDHDILPGSPQHFVWARGPLDPSQGMAEVQFHGYQFGQLKDIDVGEITWSCPPLEGVELESDNTLTESDGSVSFAEGDDPFAEQFDHRTVLQGDVVEVFWTLMPETSSIHIGARAMLRSSSKWMSIAVGDSMTDSWAWVATLDDSGDSEGVPQLLAYRMSGLDASSVKVASTEEQNAMMTGPHNVSKSNEFGHLSFDVVAQWPLPGMDQGATSAPLIWAVGPSWRSGPDHTSPRREDEHSARSKASTTIDFATGAARLGKAPSNSMLLAHGAMMWIAWLIAAPLTCAASRFVRNDPCVPDGTSPNWIQLHKAGAATAMLFSLIGLILGVVAVSQTGLAHILSSHAKMGVALVAMIVTQNFFGALRPPADDPPPPPGFHLGAFTKRNIWSWSHRIFAITMLTVAVAAVITGSSRLEAFDTRARYGVTLSIVWIIIVAVYLFIHEVRKARIASAAQSTSATGQDKLNDEEEDMLNTEDSPMMEPTKSPWISTYWVVYVLPFMLGIVVLVILTAVTFTGSKTSEVQMTEASAIADSTASSSVVDDVISLEPTAEPTEGPLVAPEDSMTDFVPSEVSSVGDDCTAVPFTHVGDGWCDDFEPFNTAVCGWDGGDCCDTGAAIYNCKDPASPKFGLASPVGWPNPLSVPRNPRYTVTRDESLESFVTTYNNYYEFGLSKDISDEAMSHADFLAPDSWYIDVSGLVENPMTLDVTSLIEQMQLEERLYRHRCVEAWSITAPWIGFPLAKLLDIVRPQAEAEIVQFVSWKDLTVSKTQSSSNYPWPYTEALTIEEARNELTMLTVGAFGKPLTPQQGAPLRLTVPWKYGFKSIKSIEKITFLADDSAASRRTFWNEANAAEYGFYANVNPLFPHRRWSQATERHYVEGFPGNRLDTTRMNGYQKQVDYLYEDLEDKAIYY